jgi:hypothetical protein
VTGETGETGAEWARIEQDDSHYIWYDYSRVFSSRGIVTVHSASAQLVIWRLKRWRGLYHSHELYCWSCQYTPDTLL